MQNYSSIGVAVCQWTRVYAKVVDEKVENNIKKKDVKWRGDNKKKEGGCVKGVAHPP